MENSGKKRCCALAVFCLMSIGALCNPVVIGNSRFTFITENLVRMEYALDGKFIDEPTLFADNRAARYDSVQVTDKGNHRYEMVTPVMRIEYQDDGYPLGQGNLKVYYYNPYNRKTETWNLASRQYHNLKGAISTLDEVNGEVPRQDGLLNRDGWFVINDSGKELLQDGWIASRSVNHLQDVYLFIYGDDYKAALQAYRTISGAAPMPRKYVHGSWYCRWWNYTDQDYRDLVEEYRRHDFPLDIMVFDMGWHRQDATVGTGHAGTRGWTGYSWNRSLIPDPARLIGDFRRDSIYVVLNEHPHDGLRPHEDAYPAFARELGINPKSDPVPLFDAGDRRYMSAFMKHAHQESDSMGVAFWWLDWQQDYLYPYVRPTHARHLDWLNKLYYDYSRRNNLRGAGFSRWAGFGDQKHPIQFSGDAVGNWQTLRFEVDLTVTSGNAGCFFWAHDLGGFYEGRSSELYTRWTQFGLLNSSLRVHSVIDKDLDRRPWLWGEAAERAMRRIYHLRSRLMPYIYTSVHQCYTDMLPLQRGMYIEYPKEEEAYRHSGQFLFGDLMLGAPVTAPGEGDSCVARTTVWLPAGDEWYHFFTGQRYAGGQTVEVTSSLQEFPLFVKSGYPLPMQPYTDRMCSTPLTTLVVRCYPGEVGRAYTYTLYEDDGMTLDYQRGISATTPITYRRTAAGRIDLTLPPAQGTYDGQPSHRSYHIELPGESLQTRVYVNGKRVKTTYDEELKGVVAVMK
jgi:alpha-glucosidase (family GH31 glycosyl hydrolase)